MKIFLTAAGSDAKDLSTISRLARRQVDSLTRIGCEVQIGVVDSRLSPFGNMRCVDRLGKEVKAFDPDVVHASYGSMVGYMTLNLASRRKPCVVSFCGDDLLGTPNPGLLWRFREKVARAVSLYAARRTDAIIVKSLNLREALPEECRGKVRIIPNGVPVEVFSPATDLERESMRETLGWKGKLVVLFNTSKDGNSNVKNPELARAAVNVAKNNLGDLVYKEIHSCTSEEVVNYMNAADCLLVTSLHEGSPNIVKEAMACNLPVVSVDCGDVKERLLHTAPSAICSYDVECVARTLISVIESGARSNGRRQLFEQRLDDESVAHRLLQVYEEVCSN